MRNGVVFGGGFGGPAQKKSQNVDKIMQQQISLYQQQQLPILTLY